MTGPLQDAKGNKLVGIKGRAQGLGLSAHHACCVPTPAKLATTPSGGRNVYTLARIRRFVSDIDTVLASDELPGTADPIAGVSALA